MSTISLTELPSRVLAEFPELEEELAQSEGLHHLQVGFFAELMQRARGRGDWEVYARAARLADALWAAADDGLRNVLNVSLLERLDFDGPRGPHAWSLLTPRLQRAWREMAAYNAWARSGAKFPPPASG